MNVYEILKKYFYIFFEVDSYLSERKRMKVMEESEEEIKFLDDGKINGNFFGCIKV